MNNLIAPYYLNNAGNVTFSSFLITNPERTSASSGLYIAGGQEILQIVRTGQPRHGGTVLSADIRGDFEAIVGGTSRFNDHGQLAYSAEILDDDGVTTRQGVFLFTPDLHWRTNGDGAWDDNTNWTLGLNPAPPPRRVHRPPQPP